MRRERTCGALPQLERKERLRGLLEFGGPLCFTEHRARDGEAFYAQACRDGWEGLIAKRADAPYQSGRTRDWLKFKCENNQEFVIGGFTDPQGSRTGLGALLLGYYDGDGKLTYAGKVGTGFDAAAPAPAARRNWRRWNGTGPRSSAGELPPRRGVHWTEPRLVGAGRVQRVDHRRAAAPPAVPGAAPGQEPGRGDPGRCRKAMADTRAESGCGSGGRPSSCPTPARCCSPGTASPRVTWSATTRPWPG